MEAEDYLQAQEEVKRAVKELKDLSWISELDCRSLLLHKCRLECQGQLDVQHVKDLMELASTLEVKGDRFTENQVCSNIDTVLKSVNFKQRDGDWIAAYKTNSLRRSELILNPDGHVGQFAYGVTLIISAGSGSSASLYLHEYNKFRKNHFHFDIPFWLMHFYLFAAFASQLLGKTDDQQEYVNMQKEIKADCPGEPRTDFLKSYRTVRPQDYPISLLAVISGWLEDDLKTGKMNSDKIRELLLIERSKELEEDLEK